MLTVLQKATILAKAGVVVPDFPRRSDRDQDHLHERDADAEYAKAVIRWNHAVAVLHTNYAMARAVRSLKEAEPGPKMDLLRRIDSIHSLTQWGR
jgi:hypothetical protein